MAAVVVVGPTASGKSELGVALAERFAGEVVSADSLQLYRHLEIGTAKPRAELLERVPHHCVDVLEPHAACSAGEYARMARTAVDGIRSRGRLAIIVGGSGLYLRALIEGLDVLPPSEPRWRQALTAIESRCGPQRLRDLLQRLDPVWAASIDAADRQRRLRALEVTLREGVPFSRLLRDRAQPLPGRTVWVGLDWPRPELYRRIEERVDQMLAAGWQAEVAALLRRGVAPEAHALQAIGYRELVEQERGATTLSQAREAIVIATRRYAKRQMTWFRNKTPTVWFDPETDSTPSRLRSAESAAADPSHRWSRLVDYVAECLAPAVATPLAPLD